MSFRRFSKQEIEDRAIRDHRNHCARNGFPDAKWEDVSIEGQDYYRRRANHNLCKENPRKIRTIDTVDDCIKRHLP